MDDSQKLSPNLPGMQPSPLFPKLTQAQIERVALFGNVRQLTEGETLSDIGDQIVSFFIIKHGQINIIRVANIEDVVAVCRDGQFTGEFSIIAGHRSLVRLRIKEGTYEQGKS